MDKLAGGDGKDEASSTVLSQMADGSNATTASPTALDLLVNGSNAPPESTTALDLSVNVSNTTREGEAMAAGAVGNNDTPMGNNAAGDSSIPPIQQSTLFLHLRGGVGSEQPMITDASVQNGSNVLSKVEDRIGRTPQVSCLPAASNARALSSLSAVAACWSTSATANVGGTGIAVVALAATTPITVQDARLPGADKNCVRQSPLARRALVNSFLSEATEAAQTVDVATVD